MKIAICDDEKIFLKKMNNLIVSNYANPDKLIICEFESGEQFLSQFKANQFDVIILDIEMKELTGLDVPVILDPVFNFGCCGENS